MMQFKTMSDDEFKKYNNLLNEYKNEREVLKENYHKNSKKLTSKIYELEHIVTKENGIRNKKGKYWIDYKADQIFKEHESGMSIENIANKFETTNQSVKNVIESKYRFINRMKLRDYFKKTNGLINDSLQMDVLFFWNILTASKYKNKGINTLADFYKNINNLTKSEITKVESAVVNAQRVFKYWEEQKNKEWRYNG
jgi:Mor family transcriptional regulator